MSDSEEKKYECKYECKCRRNRNHHVNNPINRTTTFGDYMDIFASQNGARYIMMELFGNLIIDGMGGVGDMGSDYDQITENKMMEIAMQESLLTYNTQEKKPNIKINVNKQVWNKSFLDKTCAICKNDCCKGEDIIELTCNHVFHSDCISEWVMYKAECPVCRAKIPVLTTENVGGIPNSI